MLHTYMYILLIYICIDFTSTSLQTYLYFALNIFECVSNHTVHIDPYARLYICNDSVVNAQLWHAIRSVPGLRLTSQNLYIVCLCVCV